MIAISLFCFILFYFCLFVCVFFYYFLGQNCGGGGGGGGGGGCALWRAMTFFVVCERNSGIKEAHMALI